MRKLFLSIIVVLSFAGLGEAQDLLPQANKKGMWGFVNEKGKFAIKPTFQNASKFSSGLACVKINGYYGYVNTSGELVIEAKYGSAEPFNGQTALCSNGGKYGIINTSGSAVVSFDYIEINPSLNGKYFLGKKENDQKTYLIVVSKGIAAINGFDSISQTYSNEYATVRDNGKYGYISQDGTIAVAPLYVDELSFNSSGTAVSHTEYGYGITDNSFKNIIPDKYSYVKELSNGNYIYGNKESAFGLVSRTGKILFNEDEYQSVTFLDAKYMDAAKSSNGRHVLLDMEGKAHTPECESFSIADGVASFVADGSQMQINLTNGNRAVFVNGQFIWSKNKAESIYLEEPFVVWVDSYGKTHRMTKKGVPVFEDYSSVKKLVQGKYVVDKKGKVAVADADGNILSEWVDKVETIQTDYLKLVKEQGFGRTNCAIMRISNGKMITGWDFWMVYKEDSLGLIPVELLTGSWMGPDQGMLKMNGDSYYAVEDISENMYSIKDTKTQKFGVMNSDGKIIVTPKYDEIGQFNYGMCIVGIRGKGYGFINSSGVLAVACKYAQVDNFGCIIGLSKYTVVRDKYGNAFYIDKKGSVINPDKVAREAYGNQSQGFLYY